jgi:hypothetical protein
MHGIFEGKMKDLLEDFGMFQDCMISNRNRQNVGDYSTF